MDPEAAVAQFVAVTGASPAQATFYLESANGDLERAVAAFFDAAAGVGAGAAPSSASTPASASANAERIPTADEVVTRSSRIATLGGLGARSPSDQDKNTYYAGGKNSGVAVQGPPDASKSPKSVVDDILKLASAGGPRPGASDHDDDDEHDHDHDDFDSDEEEGAAPKLKAFTGAGYRLGSEEDPAPASGAPSAPAVNNPAPDAPRGKAVRTLTFWKEGFSIDDGPLYNYSDPASQQILNAIKSGRAPLHILNVAHGQPVDLRVAHRIEEAYVPPPPKPFSGAGNRLGSIVPGDPIAPAPVAPAAAAASSAASSSSTGPAQPAPSSFKLDVDPTKPITSIQLRLADGTRLVSKFNATHTLADLRQVARLALPNQRAFTLHTTFPMRELTDDKATLESLGLLNAVVVQKFA
ncbi:protein phosphatase regulator [Blastocladiella emersonii ATCC 22665]|nr:protein phosphatase regulator [Blastocladiella emersonii ATCC 22665]